ncbi:redoxin family protein [Pirellulales bacterium]|nr:redoxin family protein [Pirellulales bacterium]
MTRRIPQVLTLLAAICCLAINAAQAVSPSAADALKLKPLQGNVPFDYPDKDELDRCTIKAEKIAGATAWVVRGPGGAVLRQFADANGDNVVDTWCYFENGVETYRDLDADFNGKADQYRWLQTAGSRWGLDKDEDGKVDSWKSISPEEAAEEAVAALRMGDGARFQRLLLTDEDIKELGFDKETADSLHKRITQGASKFKAAVTAKKLAKDAEFSDFGGVRPGLVPAGTRGLETDVLVYENAWAMVLNGDEHEQVQLGAMLRVGDAWKLIDGPEVGGEGIAGGFFYTDGPAVANAGPVTSAPNEKMQKLLADIEKIDARIAAASAKDRATLNERRVDLLEQVAAAAPAGAERREWLTQLADMVSAAVQDGSYPGGVARMAKIEAALAGEKADPELITHFKFRRMQAENSLRLADPKANYAKVQAAWLEQLEKFVEEHRDSQHAAEALLQLAMASEFSNEEKNAEKWYRQIAKEFPKSPSAAKAQGAVTRLTCEGRTLQLAGDSVRGGKVDLRQFRGKPVVVQYWISSYPACKAEHAVLNELYAELGSKKFGVLGVNLDYTRDELVGYLKDNPLPWRQIHEPGGFDSRPANEMGVIILPLMVLVDEEGKVVSRDVTSETLEDELKKML